MNTLPARRLGVDTYQERVVYMHHDCLVCRVEGFEAQSRIELSLRGRRIAATLNVVMSDLLRGGPADRAGLRAGDIIVGAVNGKDIAETDALINETAALSPGRRASFKIMHGGEPATITVELGQRPVARKQ